MSHPIDDINISYRELYPYISFHGKIIYIRQKSTFQVAIYSNIGYKYQQRF